MTVRKVVRVADVMDRNHRTIDGIATVAEALTVLTKHEAHFLIVNKRSEDDEYGILLVADIAKHVLAKNHAPERNNVYEIMSKPVLSVRPEMDIRYCARLFHRFGIHTAPVVDGGGEIKGVVTYDRLVLQGLVDDASG